MTDTGFVCAGEGELIFTSERPVIAWLLLGSLKALTRMLYKVDVNIKIEPVEAMLAAIVTSSHSSRIALTPC